ncbi:putative glycosyl transferase [compost metagenome]
MDDGATGLLIPPENPGALADALVRLANDPEERSRMGEAGRRRAEARFSAEVQIRKLIQHYERHAATSSADALHP